MDAFIEFLKLIIPAAAVLYGMFLTVRLFINRDHEKRILDMREKMQETAMPLRLQAYERLCLFLERTSPNNLIIRLNQGNLTAKELQSVLLHEIREEFNHNLSQQLYMSDEAWNLAKKAMEEIVSTINTSASEMVDDAKGIDLAKRIFEKMLEKETDPVQNALTFLKDEIRQFY
ncbi:MAG: hypothetical protein RJQ09_04495 [Cyclobacteriaceae bacterium]